MEIIRYKSKPGNKIEKSVKITDYSLILKILEEIEKIPPDGDMMISFSSKVKRVDLIFSHGSENRVVQLYGKMFKTPSTGFSSTSSDIESRLYSMLMELLLSDK